MSSTGVSSAHLTPLKTRGAFPEHSKGSSRGFGTEQILMA